MSMTARQERLGIQIFSLANNVVYSRNPARDGLSLILLILPVTLLLSLVPY